MEENTIKYQKRIVCFLDVLGFKEKLYEFEKDAKHSEGTPGGKLLTSRKANEFVKVFKDVTALINDFDCNYYLFSDNICITVDPLGDKSLATEILFTVNSLYEQFSKLGYFLRGGIDYGWMLDENDLALGVPLINAYLIESKQAVYPRVVLSNNFVSLLKDYEIDEDIFLRQNCETIYINPFYNVVKTDDKVNFFLEYKQVIEKSLADTNKLEQVNIKFEWLAREYNWFLSQYIDRINYIEQDLVLEDFEIQKLKELSITLDK